MGKACQLETGIRTTVAREGWLFTRLQEAKGIEGRSRLLRRLTDDALIADEQDCVPIDEEWARMVLGLREGWELDSGSACLVDTTPARCELWNQQEGKVSVYSVAVHSGLVSASFPWNGCFKRPCAADTPPNRNRPQPFQGI